MITGRHQDIGAGTPDIVFPKPPAVPMSIRQHALKNPRAIMREPLTLELHQKARMVIDPLRLFDCCLITDADIPGLSGLALLRELHKLHVDIPVLMLVGTSTSGMIEAARRSGAVGVIQKPCLDHTLIDLVLEFRGEAAAVQSNGRG